jgi:hypothetical protein
MRSVDRNTVKSIMTDRLSASQRDLLLHPPNFCLAPGFLRLVRHTPTLPRELPSTAPTLPSFLLPFCPKKAAATASDAFINYSYTDDTVYSMDFAWMVHIVLPLPKRSGLLFYTKGGMGPIPAGGAEGCVSDCPAPQGGGVAKV